MTKQNPPLEITREYTGNAEATNLLSGWRDLYASRNYPVTFYLSTAQLPAGVKNPVVITMKKEVSSDAL